MEGGELCCCKTRQADELLDAARRLMQYLSGPEELRPQRFDLLQREGCLIESADKASGLIVARQVLTEEPVIIVPMAGEIRRLSFVVQPAHLTSEVRLTVYVSHQWYLDDASGFTTEELGLSTDPEIYRSWFEKLDRAVPR